MRSLAFLIILLLSNSLLSAEPVKVLSGIFILDIHDIDIKNETFNDYGNTSLCYFNFNITEIDF
jgi:hypothetical protein